MPAKENTHLSNSSSSSSSSSPSSSSSSSSTSASDSLAKENSPTRSPSGKSRTGRTFDVAYVQRHIDEGFPLTQMAEGRDLVLVIGNAGVGKSTTVNYMLGHKMQETKQVVGQGSKTVIETVGPATLKIGHKVTSETLYATPVINDAYPWVFTDCPGFLGNRSVEDRVVESISIELVIRAARQVKGICVLGHANK